MKRPASYILCAFILLGFAVPGHSYVMPAEQILDFMIKHLGAPVYNQAVQDARAFMHQKLEDLDGECYETEPPP